MAKDSIYTSIDVGTTKICTIVTKVNEEREALIKGVGVAPANGLRKGVVVNIDEVTEAIQASIDEAEHRSGAKIASAYVGITGGHINSINNRSMVNITNSEHLITPEDVTKALESARAYNIPSNREVLHILPRGYAVDGQEGVSNPVGLHGYRLDAETHIVTGATTSIQNLAKCFLGVGVEIDDLILEPLASSEAVLTDEEKEMGVALADIGGGTTDIALFIEGSVWHTTVLPVGGYHLTNDIAIGMRTPFLTAEEIKIRNGSALPDEIDTEESIEVTGFGDYGVRSVLRRHVCEIIKARTQEILELILLEIKRSGYDAMLPAGLVLTGGTANLAGIETLAQEVLRLPVRVGRPRGISGLSGYICDPAYATSVGLLLWGLKHGKAKEGNRKRGQRIGRIGKRLFLGMRELFPQ